MTFQEKYLSIVDIVKEDIERVKMEQLCGISIQEPLKTQLFSILNAPSKHIRSVITFLYLKALGIKIDDRQIMFQSAIELAHNASLIHDDVIDESRNRRSVQTLNAQFGNKLAIITGDYLLSIALKKIKALNCTEIIDMFAQTLDEMCRGEIKQYFNKFKITSIEEYIRKTELKTAKLFETALNGSLILSGEDKNGLEFARNFGIAFQIRDDLINIKTTKSDIKDGIYTAPVIFSDSTDAPENGIEKTQILLNNYIGSAYNSIKNFEENKYKTALKELLGLIKNG